MVVSNRSSLSDFWKLWPLLICYHMNIKNDHNKVIIRRMKMKLRNLSKIKYFICLVTPLALSPLAVSPSKESRCAFVLLWMAIYWVLEPVHLAVTALMPVLLMPLLGILDSQDVVSNYMKEVLMMFIGGLGVAVAVEHCNLHERIALKVLMILGTDTKWLMLGFMLTTMFLSMWISNTATSAMMVPIIEAIMVELREKDGNGEFEESVQTSLLHKTLLLSVAYSANCGGTGTITGTSPNMILKGFIEQFYPESSEITYASWLAYNVPGMLLCTLAGWLLLQVIYVPCWRKQNKEARERIKRIITSRYKELGRITFHEAAVFGLFVLLVFLWVFREPKFMPGWVDLLDSEKKVGDAVPAIFILFLMFLLPAEPWRLHKSPPLLTWTIVQKKLPWGIVLLLGGGYALASGAEKSGFSTWLGDRMSVLSVLSPVVVLIILCVVTATLTEIMSNSAVTTLILPVVNQMAIAFKVNPLYFMLPATIVASYAFMLPVATGPNAIVFDTGFLETLDMVKPGILMNVFACVIQLFMIHTLGNHLFSLNEFPTWANFSLVNENETTISNFTTFYDIKTK